MITILILYVMLSSAIGHLTRDWEGSEDHNVLDAVLWFWIQPVALLACLISAIIQTVLLYLKAWVKKGLE